MDTGWLLREAKEHARVDFCDDDVTLELMLQAAVADVLGAANIPVPDNIDDIPGDLRFAICDQTAMLYDVRSVATTRDRPLGLSLAASRIAARHRGVALERRSDSQGGDHGDG